MDATPIAASPDDTFADREYKRLLEGAPPPGRAARIGKQAMLLGLAGLLVWAAFAPLDEGVPTPGMVVVDTKRKAGQQLVLE